MKLKLATFQSLFILIALCLSAFSQAAPALWSVEKNGVTSYIFGTVHVGDKSMEGLPKFIKNAIHQSKYTVVELDINALSPLDMQRKVAHFIASSQNIPLQEALSPSVYKQLQAYFTKRGINIDLFRGQPVWMVMLTMIQLEYQKAGYSDEFGIDKQVIAYAKQLNKPIKALETFEQQLSMFSKVSTMSDEMMGQTLAQMADAKSFINDMIGAWKTGDDARLKKYYKLSFDDTQYARLAEQILLVERNHAWIKTLAPAMAEESHFIAVGALHLPLEHGIIAGLQAQGFTVKRQ
ncbi:TraB/GumN family protein [Pseudoalteromonas sp. SMS1]|uniref:TraB/GumN family protein n=1 Tax=Pseudoalteromonas sp. SMS1 TaxID=2908894 RepID=UPI001F2E80A2|nr:TraB/GumN family protein [Pseudoalteromonas sp. SMS1]MCF2858894.1 TraB/GumN family protein [Pseudoalteromonas sp. SMS1]